MIAPLKRKYRTGLQYKNQKSTSSISGKGNKKKDNKGARPPKLIGTTVLLVNHGPDELYCEGTGKVLPRNGSIIVHGGKKYISRSAIPNNDK